MFLLVTRDTEFRCFLQGSKVLVPDRYIIRREIVLVRREVIKIGGVCRVANLCVCVCACVRVCVCVFVGGVYTKYMGGWSSVHCSGNQFKRNAWVV